MTGERFGRMECPTAGNLLHRLYNFNLGSGTSGTDNGNVISIANCRDTGRTQNFTYDTLNRIQTAATQATTGANCWGQRFGYLNGATWLSGFDAAGNLSHISVTQCTAPSLSTGVNNLNQLTGLNYDQAGNMTLNGSASYTYDAENRLTSTGGYTYVYDGDGRRVKKCSTCTSASGGTLYWDGAGSEALAESDLAGNLSNEYIMFAGKRTARRAAAGTVSYYFGDHLGSTSVLTDASGNCLRETDFYPYGGTAATICGSDANAYKFTGKERDTESGLDYFGARYYASNMGRWMSPDWADKPEAVPYSDLENPQSLNLYGYVNNNPLSKADPDGHCPQCVTALFGGLIGAGVNVGITYFTKTNATKADYEGAAASGFITGAVAGFTGVPVYWCRLEQTRRLT